MPTVLAVGLGLTMLAQSAETRYVIATQGGTQNNTSVQLEWTLGEPATSVAVIRSGMLTAGFHQPDLRVQKFPSTALAGNSMIPAAPSVMVFPNPTSGVVRLRIGNGPVEPVRILLTDLAGKPLYLEDIQVPATQELDLLPYPSGIYLLRIFTADGTLNEAFRVVKQH